MWLFYEGLKTHQHQSGEQDGKDRLHRELDGIQVELQASEEATKMLLPLSTELVADQKLCLKVPVFCSDSLGV